MALVRVPDRETGGWELDVEAEIARVSSKYGAPGQGLKVPRPRWGENVVWRLTSGKYAVLRGSYSMIFHTEPTTCRTVTKAFSGQPATVDDLPDEAIPCPRCNPDWPEDLPPDTKIRYEFPRQSMDICDTPAQVIARLTEHRKHSGERVVTVSEPVRDLISQCRQADQAFATTALPMQRIG
jgi:hypothetical protein